jgi:XRE family transcriptional regulator, master regulator for biofilm formation
MQKGSVMTIGERVKQLRRRRRLTQSALAERAGLRQSHISQLESGARANPQAHIVIALAHALDCSTDYLLGMYEVTEQQHAS